VKPSVSILSYTLSASAVGRGWVLVEFLGRAFDVHIVAFTRYGGIWILHARDERLLSPALDDEAARRESERTVVFAGTPRKHKGLFRSDRGLSVRAPAGLSSPDLGGALDPNLVRRVNSAADPRLPIEPPIAIAKLPSALVSASLVVIPQQDGRSVARNCPPSAGMRQQWESRSWRRPWATSHAGVRMAPAFWSSAVTPSNWATPSMLRFAIQTPRARWVYERMLGFLNSDRWNAWDRTVVGLVTKLLRGEKPSHALPFDGDSP
jgi:hypothetical protein